MPSTITRQDRPMRSEYDSCEALKARPRTMSQPRVAPVASRLLDTAASFSVGFILGTALTALVHRLFFL